jgi:hypothetical protein
MSRAFDRVFSFDSQVHQRYHVRRSGVTKFLYEIVLKKSNTVLRRVGKRSGKNQNVQKNNNNNMLTLRSVIMCKDEEPHDV